MTSSTPWAVHTLDPVELDVTRRGWAADPGQRTARIQHRERLRHVAGDLVGAHDADVDIGEQREHAASLTRSGVQHDGPGLGDRRGTAGDHGVDGVKLGV